MRVWHPTVPKAAGKPARLSFLRPVENVLFYSELMTAQHSASAGQTCRQAGEAAL